MSPTATAEPIKVSGFGRDSINVNIELKMPDLEIALPPLPEKQPKKDKRREVSRLVSSEWGSIFREQRYPEPVYFQAFDCVGVPGFLADDECRKIIWHAEAQGFTTQRRNRLVDMDWSDIVDPLFAEALWRMCGLEWLLQGIKVDGMVPCGLNSVVRIQKFGPGGVLGRHVDQCVRRADGRVSQYSLRVFLNGREEHDDAFQGGLSLFHLPCQMEPIALEPEAGLALLYPQGERCTLQEEQQVTHGCKYVLRADVLFCAPGDL